MKSGVFAKSNYFKQMGCDGRDFRSILQYVYAENRLADKNFDLPMMKKWAEIIWQLPDNDWFVRDFQQFVEDKYKKYLKKFPESGQLGLAPDEFMSLSIFHTDSRMENLIFNLMAFGRIKTNSKFDNNYIYFRSVRSSELDTAHKTKYVVKKSLSKTFFWLDVGTWSSPQSRKDENGSAMIGIMTPDEVALFDIKKTFRWWSGVLLRLDQSQKY
jgi:hypothetical protein